MKETTGSLGCVFIYQHKEPFRVLRRTTTEKRIVSKLVPLIRGLGLKCHQEKKKKQMEYVYGVVN